MTKIKLKRKFLRKNGQHCIHGQHQFASHFRIISVCVILKHTSHSSVQLNYTTICIIHYFNFYYLLVAADLIRRNV